MKVVVSNVYVLHRCNLKIYYDLQSQAAALPRHQEEEETDKTEQAQLEQTYEKY